MYDTEKRIELVKRRMHEYHRRQERRTVCRCLFCVPVIPVSRGSNGDNAKQANKRYGNVRVQSCCMRTQAVMCWWLSFPLLWQL